MLRELLTIQQQALRDVQVAFSMWVKANGLPDEVRLEAVRGDVIVIQLPDASASGLLCG